MSSVHRRSVLYSLFLFLRIHYPFVLHARQAGEKHLNKEFKKKPRVTEVLFSRKLSYLYG